MSQITRYSAVIPSGTYVETLTSNSGGAVGPDGAGNIDIQGDLANNITGIGTPGSNLITFGITGTTLHALQIGNGSGSLTSLGVATNGQIPIGSTANDPVLATLTAGTGISITNGAGSITIDSTGGLDYVEVTGTSDTADPNTRYSANNAGLVTITLNSTIPLGSIIRVTGKGTGGWRLAQQAGQTIHFGLLDTTTGAAGYLESTQQYDSVTIECQTADTDFVVVSSVGNITVN